MITAGSVLSLTVCWCPCCSDYSRIGSLVDGVLVPCCSDYSRIGSLVDGVLVSLLL